MMDYSRYPADWKQISLDVRARAGNKCEQCGVQNGLTIVRKRGTDEYLIEDLDSDCLYQWPDGRWIKLSELPEGFDYDHPTRVVLTVHHIGTPYPDGRAGDPHDKMDCRPENLICLCQKHHLAADMKIHVENSARTRARKKQQYAAAQGQLSLFEVKA